MAGPHRRPTRVCVSRCNFGPAVALRVWTSTIAEAPDTAEPIAKSLMGQWGIYDVDDCIAAAKHLQASGDVDGEKVAITGGSAGGYTTLCALTFRDEFKAGASYYGISDLSALAQATHKFESRYMDSLIGP